MSSKHFTQKQFSGFLYHTQFSLSPPLSGVKRVDWPAICLVKLSLFELDLASPVKIWVWLGWALGPTWPIT